MELKYQEELEKHGIAVSELPEDAQTGIEQINQVKRAITMLENKGKSPSPKTLKKIKAMDKWVTYEIYDHIHDTEKNEEEIPFESEEVVDEIEEQIEESEKKEQVEETPSVDPRGLQIEQELKSLFDAGKSKMDIEDLQSSAPVCYDLLFDTYEPEEDNGIETTRYKLLERTDGMFHITKK
jgi:hypothetical protein